MLALFQGWCYFEAIWWQTDYTLCLLLLTLINFIILLLLSFLGVVRCLRDYQYEYTLYLHYTIVERNHLSLGCLQQFPSSSDSQYPNFLDAVTSPPLSMYSFTFLLAGLTLTGYSSLTVSANHCKLLYGRAGQGYAISAADSLPLANARPKLRVRVRYSGFSMF